MGHKLVCFRCRKAFNLNSDATVRQNQSQKCPDCKEAAVMLTHRFRPPRRARINKWKVAEYLYKNGFAYEHIFANVDPLKIKGYVKYPETIEKAKEFIEIYANQSEFRLKTQL